MKNRVDAAEDVLRRIAALPAPEGLEDRLQARLSASLQNAPRRSRRSLWLENLGNLFQYSAPLRAAAAVTLAVVVMGCGWLVARHTAAENSAHRQPAPLSAPA